MNFHYQHIYNNIKTSSYKIFKLTQNDNIALLIGFQSILFCLNRTHHVETVIQYFYYQVLLQYGSQEKLCTV